jgi:hypothetical protein
MAVGYITDLIDTMTPKGYAVIQPLLRRYVVLRLGKFAALRYNVGLIYRSSYGQYGTASLKQDAEDIDALIATLVEVR